MSTSSTRATADRRDAGPVALVAGGSRGLGLLIARELHRDGYTPVICARSDTELQDASDQLAREGIRVHTEVMDVGEPDQVEQVTARIEREIGPVQVLICV